MIKQLDLDKCKDNKEIGDAISKHVKQVTVEEVIDHLGKKFLYAEKLIRGIYSALTLNMNIYIYGRGGYGKTALIKEMMKVLGIPTSTISGYKDMPVEALLGMPDIPKLLSKSEYTLNFKGSPFYIPGVLLGEEFADIMPSTAAALKDILSEKGFREKNIFIESRISSMIITTNKSPESMSIDESTKAFYDSRFPIKVEVTWPSHTKSDYFKLFELTSPEEDKKRLYFLAYILEKHNERTTDIIVPRKALEILKGFLYQGTGALDVFGINTEHLAKMRIEAADEMKRKSIHELLTKMDNLIDTYDKNTAVCGFILENIRSIKVAPENIPLFEKVMAKALLGAGSDKHLVPSEIIKTLNELQDNDENKS